jgi:lipopolysaccharide export system protein LptC
MTRWQWFVLVVLLVAAFVLVLERRDDVRGTLDVVERSIDEPDFYTEVTAITQFDDDGSVRYRLAAQRISHFEGNALTRLEAPELEMRRSPQPPWSLSARAGTIRQQHDAAGNHHELVVLEDDVRVEQEQARGFIRVRTELLEIDPERRFARTDRAVMIDTSAGRTEAVGLSADLDGGVLRLSSDASQRVHTTLLPSQFRRDDAKPAS